MRMALFTTIPARITTPNCVRISNVIQFQPSAIACAPETFHSSRILFMFPRWYQLFQVIPRKEPETANTTVSITIKGLRKDENKATRRR